MKSVVPSKIEDPFFGNALRYLFQNEGGYVSDSNDSGGPTKYGVTIKTLGLWRGIECTAADVAALEKSEVEEIYYVLYWKPLGCDRMTRPSIATAIFDTGVLFGAHTAGMNAQVAARACGCLTLTLDGIVGPKTIEALNALKPASFLRAFHALMHVRVINIISKIPKNARYENGWVARIDRLKTLS